MSLREDLGMTETEYRKLWHDVQFGKQSGITRIERYDMSKTHVLKCTTLTTAKFITQELQALFDDCEIWVDGSNGDISVYITDGETPARAEHAWYCGLGMRHAREMV